MTKKRGRPAKGRDPNEESKKVMRRLDQLAKDDERLRRAKCIVDSKYRQRSKEGKK